MRMFDETMGLRRVGIDVKLPTIAQIAKMIIKGWIKDTLFTLRDRQYSRKRKLFYLASNLFYNIEKWRGVRRAVLTKLDDETAIGKYSLEQIEAKSKN